MYLVEINPSGTATAITGPHVKGCRQKFQHVGASTHVATVLLERGAVRNVPTRSLANTAVLVTLTGKDGVQAKWLAG